MLGRTISSTVGRRLCTRGLYVVGQGRKLGRSGRRAGAERLILSDGYSYHQYGTTGNTGQGTHAGAVRRSRLQVQQLSPGTEVPTNRILERVFFVLVMMILGAWCWKDSMDYAPSICHPSHVHQLGVAHLSPATDQLHVETELRIIQTQQTGSAGATWTCTNKYIIVSIEAGNRK